MTASPVLNGITHFDISGPDAEALHRFYASVFGWQIDVRGPGYALVRAPKGAVDGAIIEADAPCLTVSVAVADLNAALAASVAGGGTVRMPPTDNGWVVKAQFEDPAGNVVTLVQS